MGKYVTLEFAKVCPACANDCPFLSLYGTNLYENDRIVSTVWYCANRDMCKRLCERMEAAQNERPD
jgi:hypothetical protein